MSALKRVVTGVIAAAAFTVAAPFTAGAISNVQDAELHATEWELYVDFTIFWVCGTDCPDGAEESECCCWLPN